jgi:hypothetical protein
VLWYNSIMLPKQTMTEWVAMARRGAEDGHDDAWIALVAPTPRIRDAMLHAAQQARDALRADESARLTQRFDGVHRRRDG